MLLLLIFSWVGLALDLIVTFDGFNTNYSIELYFPTPTRLNVGLIAKTLYYRKKTTTITSTGHTYEPARAGGEGCGSEVPCKKMHHARRQHGDTQN